MKRISKWFAYAALLALLATLPVSAQLSTGSITGTIQDPAGLAVTGVEVTVVSQATGREFKATSNEAGSFTVPSLTIGLYRIVIQAAGFRKAIIENIKVDTGVQTSVPPIKLELGQVTETVTVEAGTTVVQTANAEIKDTVDAKQIEVLPLTNRNPLTLLGLQAGINTLGRTSTVINGQRPSLSNLTLDGINIQDNFIRTNSLDFTPNLPLLSQVAEFTVATSNSGAETGLGASQVTLTTPSGTNDWHAEGFWYHRNNALAANAWFANKDGRDANGNPRTPKPFLLLNQIGGSVGGPILRNKLFVYGYYEAFRQRQQTLQNHTILTDGARMGDFTWRVTCDTVTTNTTPDCPAGVSPGQVRTVNILAARLNSANGTEGPFTVDPFVANLLTQFPGTSAINNFDVGDSSSTLVRNTAGFRFPKRNNRTRDNYGVKLDWNATPRHTVYGTWAWNRDVLDRNDIDTTYTRVPIVQNDDKKRLVSATWRWTPAATFTNELNGGFNFAPATFTNQRDFGTNPVFGVATLAQTVGFLFTTPEVNFRDQGRDTDTYNLQNNASWTKGNHFFRFGYASQFIRVLSFVNFSVNPEFSIGFNTANPLGMSSNDRLPGSTTACSTGTGTVAAAQVAFTDPSCLFRGGIGATDLSNANRLLASLAGFLSAARQTFNATSTTSGVLPFTPDVDRLKLDTHAGYFADSWRVRPRMTFNYGIRWEYVGRFDQKDGLYLLPVIPSGGNVVDTLLSNATLDFAGGPTGRPLYNSDMNNFAPNIGIAWDVRGNGKTAVRAGYSVHFVNDEAIRSADNAAGSNQGLALNRDFTGSTIPSLGTTRISGTLPTFTTPNYFVPRLASDNNVLNSNLPQTIFTIDPNIRTPYVQEWNLGIQHEVGWNSVLDIHYIGNKGTKLYRGIDFNQVIIDANDFLADFNRARSNLFTFGDPRCAPGSTNGCQVLTVLNRMPSVAVATTGSAPLLLNSTIVNLIQTGQVGDLAFIYHSNNLAGPVDVVANRIAGVADLLTNSGDSSYHAGVVEIRRRFTKGLGFQANYTFGKVLSDVGGTGGTGQARFDPYLDNANGRRDRSRALFDVEHQFKANVVYDLPAGKGHRFNISNVVVEKILSGWTVGSVFNWQSGNPVSILSSRGTLNRSGRCNGRCGADSNLTASQIRNLIGVFRRDDAVYMINPSVIGPDGRGVGADALTCDFTSFSGQAFCHPAAGTFGNVGALIFSGPSLFTWDFSIIKQTAITEKLKFEYRAEFFNFLNHPVFAGRDETISDEQFGQFTAVDVAARRIQMTIRLLW